ncbi:MAG TPA: M48 family metallopeptidase, partial [Daejeonella sp.]|nr:M48 family metallopeptidase [Daejeonella sp.]
MRKPVTEGVVIVLVFVLMLWTAKQVNWMAVFKVEQNTKIAEKKLGELFWDIFRKTETETQSQSAKQAIDSIVFRICTRNKIDPDNIKVHILDKAEINAFALPDGHLVVYSGLILASANPEELSGVLGHEIAHIRLNHVIKKLMKEWGLAYLVSVSTSNSGSAQIKAAAKMLSSTAFDRSLEKEADLRAVDYLVNSDIDPIPFAHFLNRFSIDRDEKSSFS